MAMAVAVRTIMVSEIFGPTIQGEGAVIGRPTVFVRTGGCDYRCSWCDSLYAVLPEYKSEWEPMNAERIFAEVQRLSNNKPILITLSGGNPAIQPLGELIDLGHTHGYTFAIETQGSVAASWFSHLDYLTFSPKPPSSKQVTRWERLDRCVQVATGKQLQEDEHERDNHKPVSSRNLPAISFKIVIFDEEDFAYAREVHQRYPEIPLYLQPGNHTPPQPQSSASLDINGILERMDWLVQRVIKEGWYDVTVLPQLHVLLWGNKRGV